MKLIEALKIAGTGAHSGGPGFRIALNCGFTPLHLKTFLAAHAVVLSPGKAVSVTHTGLFGDLAGNLERLVPGETDAAAVVIEWQDLDERLGMRSSGGWPPESLPGILDTVRLQARRIVAGIEKTSAIRFVISLPTLPLPPVAPDHPSRLSTFEADLRMEVASLGRTLAGFANISVISPQAIDMVSPLSNRLDIRGDWLTGFPYTLEHAESLAVRLAAAVCPQARKKGLITDLDDTLWRGILGEAGVQGVCWSLEAKAQIHGIYQQFLNSIAAAGTLVAIASKNDPDLVAQALEREDLRLRKQRIFPVEAHWGPKSQSVARILARWNVGADSVIFVDDSPMELAEVQASFPEVECLLFPKDDPARFLDFLVALRAGFGSPHILAEDTLRSESLRAGAQFEAEREMKAADADSFLRAAEAEIVFTTDKTRDARAYELINKTNQFNLNGVRLTEAQWNALLADPRSFVLKVSYTDRYGPLGAIAVLAGLADENGVSIEHWVMSCRAFSRRIEHRCIEWVFSHFGEDAVSLQFAATPRNAPLREFLAGILGTEPEGPVRLQKQIFQEKCPSLYHSIRANNPGNS